MIETKKLLLYRNIWMSVAIIGIVLFHMNPISDNRIITGIQEIGYGGVDVFLFASGIGCYYSYSRIQNPYDFLVKRMKKILPMYFFALGFYFFNRSDILFREVIGNVFSYAYVGGFEHNFSWYISFLWITYILVPFIYGYINANTKHIQKYIFLGLLSVFIAISFIGNSSLIIAFSRIPIFVIGMCVGDYFSMHEKVKIRNVFALVLVSIIGFSVLIKLLHIYPDLAWEYGIYWLPYIMITPGMCFLISFICSILSLNSVISKFISIIGNVIGGNTLAIFLADTIGPFVSAILGYSWDTQEHYVMSKICIIPLSFIFVGFGYFFDSVIFKTKQR